MADQDVIVERPKKSKRPKSAKKTTDDTLGDMDDKTGSARFNELLQQAVDQTMSDAKTEKKKKKKKGGTQDSVLESLRKGEGLQKDTDTALQANIFDPDNTKYQKSNKKKQKLNEELNRQNELEVVDETKGKTKKKKKAKSEDEKIENMEMSDMSTKDKTMSISELDSTALKTPGKKKKKKQTEEETVISARSEDEPSIATTPKKKTKKKPVVEQEMTASVATLDETVLTPKKKKKKAVFEEDVETARSEEATPRRKKKKKTAGVMSEDEVLSQSEDVVSPKGKKKKKKGGELTEDEAVLSQTEEPTSPKGKKGKKKKAGDQTDEEVPGTSGEPLSPKGKGKKKKKKGEDVETEEEGVLSQTEDLASPTGKGKKKKKKKTEDEETQEEEPEEEEAPKPKPRKKKKKKDAEEVATEEEEEEPSGMDVEDEGRILAVTIHRTDKLKNDFYIMHPMVRVHIFDELTGKYLPKQHKDRAVTAYYETLNEKVTHVLPIMTKPFDFKQEKSVLPVWEELLVFNENYNYFIQDKPKVLLVFELLDFVSMNRAAQNDGHERGWHRIAWAFLKVKGNNQKINAGGSKVRLQLFEAPSGMRRKADVEEMFMWWRDAPRKTYPSTLYVTLKGIRPPQEVEPAERSLFATQKEEGRMTYEDLKKSVNWGSKMESKPRALSSWSRLAGQMCRIPNTLAMALPTAKKGCYIIRFSHDGRSIACACQGKEGYPILVYEIPSGTLRGKFQGHFGVVYDMSWSKMDTHLMSASSDGTARIWDLQEMGEQQQKLIPHPAFVYCAQFHPRVDTVCVTGGYDQVIRIWDISNDISSTALKQELEDHVGYINSICFSEDGQKMYSADSIGVIIIWNAFISDMPSRRGFARDWTVYQKIEDPEIKGTAINYIMLHPRERRLLVHCRDNIIRMFDLRIQRVMQKYIGALNFREQIKSTLSPCGSFVFSGSEDNFAYAWNTDTGDQVIMYSELNYQNPVTDVHYHPRDHMVAFCSLGENHPVLIYSYDPQIAQMDAGLSPRYITPIEPPEKLGSSNLNEELATKGVLTREEFQLHSAQRYDKVMRTLNKVTTRHLERHVRVGFYVWNDLSCDTQSIWLEIYPSLAEYAQMSATTTLDLPGMTPSSPRLGSTGMMMGSTGYDSFRSPRTMTGSPTLFSPHAPRSMSSVMQHQQFASQNMYMKATDTWRPGFTEVGRHGTRSLSPVMGRTPQLNMSTSQQGKAQFSFQAAPGKAVTKHEQVVVMYDYKAQRSDELNLFAGDIVNVLYKDTENWWMGELKDGQQGFFPSNYVTQEDELIEVPRTDMLTPDTSDTDTKKVTAVRSRSGDLKFISGEDDSGDDLLTSTRTRRRKKRNSQDSASISDTSQTSKGKRPPKKTGQKVRIDESTA